MPDSQPDSKFGSDLAAVRPLMSELRDGLFAISLGLQDVLFELDTNRRVEVAEQVRQLLERAKLVAGSGASKPLS